MKTRSELEAENAQLREEKDRLIAELDRVRARLIRAEAGHRPVFHDFDRHSTA